MTLGLCDLAQIRLDNALRLFDEFVQATIKHPDAATLRGLEGRFAERLQIQPSYWSQIKGRSRQIGERLARQFERLCHKPSGWMDQPHDAVARAPRPASTTAAGARTGTAPQPAADSPGPGYNVPQDDDERFIVGLVLTYYRRHPQRARTRLLDLLGEVLAPAAAPASAPTHPSATRSPHAGKQPSPNDDGRELWSRTQAAVAPLKRKR
ncbi:MAG: hypothetical protein AD742_17895 [Methylibium sp. NZG]|nr:MAG: hypothetical protein AD742_17895 [Methylibium sp. NZG]